MDAVFCICWLELCQAHSDTSRLCSCSLGSSLRLCALALLKENGRQARPLWRPNPVNQHSALAGSPSQIKNKIHLDRNNTLKGWAELIKTQSKLQLLHSVLKSIRGPCWANNPPQISCDQELWTLSFDDLFIQMACYLEYFSIPVFAFLASIRWIFVIVICLQESTVITCAHKASGDPTVQSAAPVRTEDPALQRTAHVCVHLDTEGPPAKEVSPVLFV